MDRNKYDLIAGNMMMLGRDLSAFITYDDISSTEFLASLPMVDAKRIGCVGCSMGAYRSWMLSALSDRIKAGASICWMITTDAQLSRRFGRKENGGLRIVFRVFANISTILTSPLSLVRSRCSLSTAQKTSSFRYLA